MPAIHVSLVKVMMIVLPPATMFASVLPAVTVPVRAADAVAAALTVTVDVSVFGVRVVPVFIADTVMTAAPAVTPVAGSV